MVTSKAVIAKEIGRQVKTTASVCPMRRTIKRSGNLKYVKSRCCPLLTPDYKKARIQFSEKHLKHEANWSNIVFSGEKMFNFDGPMAFMHIGHNLRKEKNIFSTLQLG